MEIGELSYPESLREQIAREERWIARLEGTPCSTEGSLKWRGEMIALSNEKLRKLRNKLAALAA